MTSCLTPLGLLALVLPLGCYTGLEAADDPGADASSGAEATGRGDPSDGGSESSGGEAECAPAALPVALRYLTRVEYENTVRDLFGAPMDAAAGFTPDERSGGFYANAEHAPSTTQLEAFLDAAFTLGEIAVTEHLARFVDCVPTQAECATAFITEFGRRAFRRPLDEAEITAYIADYTAIAADQGPELGLQVVATAMLASPNFLYIGDRSESDDAQLRAYDLASRLSYFVWASMPDDALIMAAETGELATAAGIEGQVRRMLADPRAADALASFATQWVEVDGLRQSAPKDPAMFPDWTAALADSAERDVGKLMLRVVQDGDHRLASLLESRDAYVDEPLAALYGVDAPEAGEGWVTLPANERAGLLTRVAFLARHAHATQNSWVHRGKVVRERLLCTTLPPPPPAAADAPIDDDSRLEDDACKGCHTLMDPIGYGFDEYDPIGRHVGGPTPGHVEGLDPADFDGAVELSSQLAAAPEVELCFAQQMFGFANRRRVADDESCAVEQLAAAFIEHDGDIVELIVALATAEAFIGQEVQ